MELLAGDHQSLEHFSIMSPVFVCIPPVHYNRTGQRLFAARTSRRSVCRRKLGIRKKGEAARHGGSIMWLNKTTSFPEAVCGGYQCGNIVLKWSGSRLKTRCSICALKKPEQAFNNVLRFLKLWELLKLYHKRKCSV